MMRLPQHKKSLHRNCHGQALTMTHTITYKLHQLKNFGLDACPKVKVTSEVMKLIEQAEELIGQIRRAL
jgi:hypothetical protein